MLVAALAGLGTGLSLIVAIGAQNAFVLRQGLRKEHVGVIVAICAFSDMALIALGAAALDSVARAVAWLVPVMRWGGAAFLAAYSLRSFRRAVRPGRLVVETGQPTPLRRAAVTCLALTWLNPHVYLDTVLLLGSLATARGADRWWFAGGAMAASWLFFATLGYGSRLLRPVFASPKAWRVLDTVIGLVMAVIAVSLARGG